MNIESNGRREPAHGELLIWAKITRFSAFDAMPERVMSSLMGC